MKNNQFRGPLLQSAALLIGVVIVASIAASAGKGSNSGGFLALISGIGNSVLFVIGLAISLGISIAILIGIFLAAVAMVSPEHASQMYSDLKKKFFQSTLTCKNVWSCCETNRSDTPVDLEEHNQMKQEIIHLQESNSELKDKVKKLEGENILFHKQVEGLRTDNASLIARIDDLNHAVNSLNDSENAIKIVIADLTAKMQLGSNPEMTTQFGNLERLQAQIRSELKDLIDRLNTLELGQRQAPTSGIFSYIDKEEYQTVFTNKVEEALRQEMTYAEIDDYLSKTLPTDLDKIIKGHPSLTRNYIRNLRRD
jgi:hypothetical protein